MKNTNGTNILIRNKDTRLSEEPSVGNPVHAFTKQILRMDCFWGVDDENDTHATLCTRSRRTDGLDYLAKEAY